jgi:hypothetical protein
MAAAAETYKLDSIRAAAYAAVLSVFSGYGEAEVPTSVPAVIAAVNAANANYYARELNAIYTSCSDHTRNIEENDRPAAAAAPYAHVQRKVGSSSGLGSCGYDRASAQKTADFNATMAVLAETFTHEAQRSTAYAAALSHFLCAGANSAALPESAAVAGIKAATANLYATGLNAVYSTSCARARIIVQPPAVHSGGDTGGIENVRCDAAAQPGGASIK